MILPKTKKCLFLLAAILLVPVVIACPPAPRPAPAHPSPAVSAPCWDELFDRRLGWIGGDVAASFLLPGERVLWLFGDSFIGEVEEGQRRRAVIVNNVIAVHPYNPAEPWLPPRPEEVCFLWGDSGGRPTAWVRPPRQPGGRASSYANWYWPTGGAVLLSEDSAGKELGIFLLEVRRTPEESGVWAFEVVGGALAVVGNVEEEADEWRQRLVEIPVELEEREGRPGEKSRISWGAAVTEDWPLRPSDWLFIYGVESRPGGSKDLLLARVKRERLEDFSAWEFYAGRRWSASLDRAQPIITSVGSELSVDRLPDSATGQYLLAASETFPGSRLLLHTAPRPEGPWSEPCLVYEVKEVKKNKNYFTYAGKAHLELSPPGQLLLSYLVNSNDFRDLLLDTAIYRPRFVLLPWTAVEYCSPEEH